MIRPPWEDPKAFGVYVHFPWCWTRCTYCDFVVAIADRIPGAAYTEAVLAELRDRADRFRDHELVSIYFGGGTPSLWCPYEIGRVVTAIEAELGVEHRVEVTLEANPDPSLVENVEAFAAAGVTRLSIGVQSLDEATLVRMSRAHTAREARAALRRCVETPGIHHVGADLIYGRPWPCDREPLDELGELADLGVDHVSLYALTLERGTAMFAQQRRGALSLPEDDAVADEALALWARGRELGYEHYELSNLARPGGRAVHNSLYWHLRGYLGLGVGAHGLEPRASGWDRRENVRNPRTWMRDPLTPASEHEMSDADWLADALIVRPRWVDGFDLGELEPWVDARKLQRLRATATSLARAGHLAIDGDLLRLTDSGLMVINGVTLALHEAAGV